jgi:hypothetical protein
MGSICALSAAAVNGMWSAPKVARVFSLNGEYLDQENWQFGWENFRANINSRYRLESR